MLDFKLKKSMPELIKLPPKRAIDEKIKQFVIQRAREIDPSLGIQAVCLGINPDDAKTPAFYFIAPGKCNLALIDLITSIDLEVAQKVNYLIDFYQWPCSVEDVKNYFFLGEVIYSNQK